MSTTFTPGAFLLQAGRTDSAGFVDNMRIIVRIKTIGNFELLDYFAAADYLIDNNKLMVIVSAKDIRTNLPFIVKRLFGCDKAQISSIK